MSTAVLEAPTRTESVAPQRRRVTPAPPPVDRRAVFEELYESVRRTLLATACRLTRDMHRAEDLVQETLIRAWQKFEHFEKGTNFNAWLFRILRFVHMNDTRRRSVRSVATDDISYFSITKGAPAEPAVDVQVGSDWSGVYSNEVKDPLKVALDRLNEHQREVLMLTTLGGLTHRECATALNIPIGTVMSRLYRARMHVQAKLR